MIIAVVASAWLMTAAAATQDKFPDGAGKPELVKACGGCHDAEIVLSTLKTPAEWTETLQDMAQQGAEATPDGWRVIETYIDANFALIPINKATAEELQSTMDVTSETARAVVKYRQERGPFRSVDDVKKVDGVEAAKVEARKNRFVF
jgi:competence protein ComEA